MAISRVQYTGNNGTGTIIFFSLSGTTAGNLLVAFITVIYNGTVSTPSGWTLAGTTQSTSTNAPTYIFYKENIAGGTESFSTTCSISTKVGGILAEYSGVETSGSLETTQVQISAYPSVSLTTSATNSLVVVAAGINDNDGSNISPTNSFTRFATQTSGISYYCAAIDKTVSAGSQTTTFDYLGSAIDVVAASFKAAGSGTAYTATTSGGIKWTGAASPTLALTASGSGGVKFAGSVNPTLALTASGSGGLKWTGTAVASVGHAASSSGGVKWGGSVNPVVNLKATASGGIKWGGTAGLPEYGSGGIKWGGSVNPIVNLKATASGGIKWTGQAFPNLALTASGSGGIKWSSQYVQPTVISRGSGGIKWGGSVSPVVVLHGTGSGGIKWSGTTTPTLALVHTAIACPCTALSASGSGGIRWGGTASVDLSYRKASGGIRWGGSVGYPWSKSDLWSTYEGGAVLHLSESAPPYADSAKGHAYTSTSANPPVRSAGPGCLWSQTFAADSKQFIALPSSPIDATTRAFTLSAWFNALDAFYQSGTIFTCPSFALSITVAGTAQARVYPTDSDAVGTVQGRTRLIRNTWYHVAATWDRSTLRIFINGVLDNSRAITGGVSTGSAGSYLGRAGDGQAGWLSGALADVRVSRAVRDAAWLGAEHRTVCSRLGLVVGSEESV